MKFLEPNLGDKGGGDGDESSSAPASATYDPWAPKGGEGETDPAPAAIPDPTKSPAPSPVTIDPAAFEAFGKSFGETFAKTQQAATPVAPPTPEQMAEARKALKFFDINDDFVAKLDNLETRKASLETFRDGITQHIITVMNHLRANDQSEFQKTFESRLSPLQSLIEERNNSERQSRFNARFPAFAKPEIAPAINATISHLASQKAFEGKTEAQSFKLVADELAKQAKAYNPNFILEDAGENASASQSPRRGNSLPVTSPGSGASRSGASSADGKNWALKHLK